MADSSGFRTKFGGFNKDDVLTYIDSLQEEHAGQLAQVQQEADAQREAYDKALGDANAALAQQFEELQAERAEQEKLQALINEQYEANRALREQAEAATDAQAENAALREQVEALKAELAAKTAAAAALQEENAALKARAEQMSAAHEQAQSARQAHARLAAENGRYRELVGDVGDFVVEVRAMGQRYLEDANAQCQGRLTAITAAIAALSEDLNAASAALSAADNALAEQHSGAEQRLDELAREMERSAADVTAPLEDAPPADFF